MFIAQQPYRVGSINHGLVRPQSIEGHVAMHLLLLIIGQDDMKLIAANAVSGSKLRSTQNMGSPLFVNGGETGPTRVSVTAWIVAYPTMDQSHSLFFM